MDDEEGIEYPIDDEYFEEAIRKRDVSLSEKLSSEIIDEVIADSVVDLWFFSPLLHPWRSLSLFQVGKVEISRRCLLLLRHPDHHRFW